MRCPHCDSLRSRVVDSRLTATEDAIRRRRACEDCQQRFTTYERLERVPVLVVKKNGQREGFDAEKLLTGIHTALHRRPVPASSVEDFVRDLELRLTDRREREVPTHEIGEAVMDFLRVTDKIAYVRYASVYREFEDIGTLLREVASLVDAPVAGARASPAPTSLDVEG